MKISLVLTFLFALAGCNSMQPSQPTAIYFGDSVSLAAAGHARLSLYGQVDLRHDAWEQEDIVPQDKPGYFQEAVERGNNNGTSFGVVKAMRRALTQDKFYTVLLFNAGLHDIQLDQTTSATRVSLDQYRENLEQAAELAHDHAVYVIWIDTTPVHSDAKGHMLIGGQVTYNQIAHQVAREHGFYILETTDYGQRPHNIHFTREGSRAFGERIKACVLAALQAQELDFCHH